MELLVPGVRMIAERLTTCWVVFVILASQAAAEGFYPACKAKVGAKEVGGTSKKNECMFSCPPDVKMACGSDGFSHINDCFLCKSACQNRHVFKMCEGRCPCKGKSHEKEVETIEDCEDGQCETDDEDHYDEDYGYDVEDPEDKYSSPVYTHNPYVLHESKGFTPAEEPYDDDLEDDGDHDDERDDRHDDHDDRYDDHHDDDH